MILKITITFLIFLLKLTNAQRQGSQCTVDATNSPGICKKSNDCPEVENAIQYNRPYTSCGFERRREIVCCPASVGRISERKCAQYNASAYEFKNAISLAIGAQSIRFAVKKCHSVVPLVIGGKNAAPMEFPHMALIGYGDNVVTNPQWKCGGSLISERFVLTAGHCRSAFGFGAAKYIRLGDLDINSDTDDSAPENYDVVRIVKHPEYVKSSKYNDIALLEMDRDVKFDYYKRPACLPDIFDSGDPIFIATGWGNQSEAGDPADHLQKVVLERFTEEDCRDKYEDEDYIEDGIIKSQLCAGSHKFQRDTCQGDSGGPLQIYHPNVECMYKLIGITSFGISCAKPGIPGVYTRIFTYLDWIESVVWPTV